MPGGPAGARGCGQLRGRAAASPEAERTSRYLLDASLGEIPTMFVRFHAFPDSEEVAKYYAARAREYDLSAGYLDAHAETLRSPLKAQFRDALQGHDVLEVACCFRILHCGILALVVVAHSQVQNQIFLDAAPL
jgi:hypothetical protein